MTKIEKLILEHRYIYYIECAPIVPDTENDRIERKARAELPEDSPVQGVGSSFPSSYPQEVIDYVMELKYGK